MECLWHTNPSHQSLGRRLLSGFMSFWKDNYNIVPLKMYLILLILYLMSFNTIIVNLLCYYYDSVTIVLSFSLSLNLGICSVHLDRTTNPHHTCRATFEVSVFLVKCCSIIHSSPWIKHFILCLISVWNYAVRFSSFIPIKTNLILFLYSLHFLPSKVISTLLPNTHTLLDQQRNKYINLYTAF